METGLPSGQVTFLLSFCSLIWQAKVEIKLNFEISSLGTSGDSRPRKFWVGQVLRTEANKGEILEEGKSSEIRQEGSGMPQLHMHAGAGHCFHAKGFQFQSFNFIWEILFGKKVYIWSLGWPKPKLPRTFMAYVYCPE